MDYELLIGAKVDGALAGIRLLSTRLEQLNKRKNVKLSIGNTINTELNTVQTKLQGIEKTLQSISSIRLPAIALPASLPKLEIKVDFAGISKDFQQYNNRNQGKLVVNATAKVTDIEKERGGGANSKLKTEVDVGVITGEYDTFRKSLKKNLQATVKVFGNTQPLGQSLDRFEKELESRKLTVKSDSTEIDALTQKVRDVVDLTAQPVTLVVNFQKGEDQVSDVITRFTTSGNEAEKKRTIIFMFKANIVELINTIDEYKNSAPEITFGFGLLLTPDQFNAYLRDYVRDAIKNIKIKVPITANTTKFAAEAQAAIDNVPDITKDIMLMADAASFAQSANAELASVALTTGVTLNPRKGEEWERLRSELDNDSSLRSVVQIDGNRKEYNSKIVSLRKQAIKKEIDLFVKESTIQATVNKTIANIKVPKKIIPINLDASGIDTSAIAQATLDITGMAQALGQVARAKGIIQALGPVKMGVTGGAARMKETAIFANALAKALRTIASLKDLQVEVKFQFDEDKNYLDFRAQLDDITNGPPLVIRVRFEDVGGMVSPIVGPPTGRPSGGTAAEIVQEMARSGASTVAGLSEQQRTGSGPAESKRLESAFRRIEDAADLGAKKLRELATSVRKVDPNLLQPRYPTGQAGDQSLTRDLKEAAKTMAGSNAEGFKQVFGDTQANMNAPRRRNWGVEGPGRQGPMGRIVDKVEGAMDNALHNVLDVVDSIGNVGDKVRGFIPQERRPGLGSNVPESSRNRIRQTKETTRKAFAFENPDLDPNGLAARGRMQTASYNRKDIEKQRLDLLDKVDGYVRGSVTTPAKAARSNPVQQLVDIIKTAIGGPKPVSSTSPSPVVPAASPAPAPLPPNQMVPEGTLYGPVSRITAKNRNIREKVYATGGDADRARRNVTSQTFRRRNAFSVEAQNVQEVIDGLPPERVEGYLGRLGSGRASDFITRRRQVDASKQSGIRELAYDQGFQSDRTNRLPPGARTVGANGAGGATQATNSLTGALRGGARAVSADIKYLGAGFKQAAQLIKTNPVTGSLTVLSKTIQVTGRKISSVGSGLNRPMGTGSRAPRDPDGPEGLFAASGKTDFKTLMSDVMVGGGFPALFGAGIGSSAGGAVGGAAGNLLGVGGFGGSLIGSLLGQYLDQLAVAATKTGNALRSPIDNFEALATANLTGSSATTQYIKRLIELGHVTEANAVIQQEALKKMTSNQYNELIEVGEAATELGKAWTDLNIQMQIAIAGPLKDLLIWATDVINLVTSGVTTKNAIDDTAKSLSDAPQSVKDDFNKTVTEFIGARGVSELRPEEQVELKKILAGFQTKYGKPPEAPKEAVVTDENRRIEADAAISRYEKSRDLARQGTDLQMEADDFSRDVAEQVFNFKRRAADLDREAAQIRRDIEEEIVSKRTEIARLEASNDRKRAQVAIERFDLELTKAGRLQGRAGGQSELVQNAQEYIRTIATGEADIAEQRINTQLDIDQLQRDSDKFKFDVNEKVRQLREKADDYQRDVDKFKFETSRKIYQFQIKAADYWYAQMKNAYELAKGIASQMAIAHAMTNGAAGSAGGSGGQLSQLASQFSGILEKVESAAHGGYNAFNTGGSAGGKVAHGSGTADLVNMTVEQVMAKQRAKEWHATGKYQIVGTTLAGLMNGGYGETGVGMKDKYNAQTQDKLYLALLRQRVMPFLEGTQSLASTVKSLREEWVGLDNVASSVIESWLKQLRAAGKTVLFPGAGGGGGGGGSVVFGRTGRHSLTDPDWAHGHFQTKTGTVQDLINDVFPILRKLVNNGITVEMAGGQYPTKDWSDTQLRSVLGQAVARHTHSGDGRSLDLNVKGLNIPVGVPVTNITDSRSNGGFMGDLSGGRTQVMHLPGNSTSDPGGGSGMPVPEPYVPLITQMPAPTLEGIGQIPVAPGKIDVTDILASYDQMIQRSKAVRAEALKLTVALKDVEASKAKEVFEARNAQYVKNAIAPLTELNKEMDVQFKYDNDYANLLRAGVLPALAERLAGIDKTIDALREKNNEDRDSAILALAAGRAELKAAQDALAAAKLKKDAKEIEKAQKNVDDKAKVIPALESSVQATTDADEAITAQGDLAKQTAALAESSFMRINAAAIESQKTLLNLLDPVNQIIAQADAVGQAFSTAFTGLVTGSKTAGEAFSEMARSIGESFTQMAAQMLTEYLKLEAIKLFAKLFTPGSATGGGVPLNAYANGGRPPVGIPSIVGEDGPELFIPGVSGTIIPSSESISVAQDLLDGEDGADGYDAIGNARSAMRGSLASIKGSDGQDGVVGAAQAAMQRSMGGMSTSEAYNEMMSERSSSNSTVKIETIRVGDLNVVTEDQLNVGMAEATKRGAKQGEASMLRRMKNNVSIPGIR